MHSHEVYELLTQEYTLILAQNTQHFEAVKEVRREVFSYSYNNISPDELEKKGYFLSSDDEQSFIYLLRHNPSKKYVGTVRLFFINQRTPIQKLPMQKDGNVKDINHLTQNFPSVELSRGALTKYLPVHETYSTLKLRTLLISSLMIATRINFLLYPYTNIFSIMERPLHRILKRQKINFVQIGEPVDYYGIRIPYALKRETLIRDTENTMRDTTLYYLKKLCQNPDSFWKFIDKNPYLERSDIQLDRICQLLKEYGDDLDISLILGKDTPSIT